ncbi:hypothetical protein BGY98DRAFT_54660 [Russula aff. rugulosa BPL654]|nr:hypothetical protein BGY98DRAFT_54660 [Russula aff. rugulosa BPL654]
MNSAALFADAGHSLPDILGDFGVLQCFLGVCPVGSPLDATRSASQIRDSRDGSSPHTNRRCLGIGSHSLSLLLSCYPRPHSSCQHARCKRHCPASPRRRIMCRDWDSSSHTVMRTGTGMC